MHKERHSGAHTHTHTHKLTIENYIAMVKLSEEKTKENKAKGRGDGKENNILHLVHIYEQQCSMMGLVQSPKTHLCSVPE